MIKSIIAIFLITIFTSTGYGNDNKKDLQKVTKDCYYSPNAEKKLRENPNYKTMPEKIKKIDFKKVVEVEPDPDRDILITKKKKVETKRVLEDPDSRFKKVNDVAQYKGASWENMVKIKRGITLEEAKDIAFNSKEITFFFYMKGYSMYLEGKPGKNGWSEKGVFKKGDAVFFSGKPWYGSAKGYADAYEKK